MRILSSEPFSAISEDIRQILESFPQYDIHSFIQNVQLQDFDGLFYLSDWAPVLNGIDEYLENIINEQRKQLFHIQPTMDCDTSFEGFANLVNILKFTGALLKNSFGKEVYNSVEHLLILTYATSDDIACEAVDCLYSLARFPDIHHSVVLEDRHLTTLHKNQPYYWQIFQMLESLYPYVPLPNELDSFVPQSFPTSLTVGTDLPGNIGYSQSALAALFTNEIQSDVYDSGFEVAVSGNGCILDYMKMDGCIRKRYCGLWALRGVYWNRFKAGRLKLVSMVYKLSYIVFSSYPDYNFVTTFYADKLRLLKDFVHLISSESIDQQAQNPEFLELRILACFCISSLLDTKDQSSSPLGLLYPWLFQDLGVNRGQYMGLVPQLFRSCCASLTKIRPDLIQRFGREVKLNKDLTLKDTQIYQWSERLIILVYYLCNLNISLPTLLENGLVSSMLLLINVTEEVLFPFQMWIDNMALTVLEVIMTPNTNVHTTFRDHDGPDIVLRRMYSVITAFLQSSCGNSLPASQVLLVQQFISLISCYMQESRGDGDDGQVNLLYRNTNLHLSFAAIFDNAAQFHTSVVSASTALMAEIMNRDSSPPATVNWMLSQGLVRKALMSLHSRPSIANSDLPLAVISLVSAVSLSTEGIEVVRDTAALEFTLEYLGDIKNFLPFSVNMMTDQASSLGASVEELMRHYPTYADLIVNKLIDLVDRIYRRAKVLRNMEVHDFSFNGKNYNHSTEYSALLHSAVACACCIEPILSRNVTAAMFMRAMGLNAIIQLKDISLGTYHQFLVSMSCALEGSNTSLGYPVLVSAITRCIHHLAESSSMSFLPEVVLRLSTQIESVMESVQSYGHTYVNNDHTCLFWEIIDSLPLEPFQLISRDKVPQMHEFANCLMSLVHLDFLYEAFGSVQGGRHQRRINPGELLVEDIKSRFVYMLRSSLENIYCSSQQEMSRYRRKKRISGLSTEAVTTQPVFLLQIISDFAILRQSIDDNSKRTGKMLRGTFVEATERQCSSSGLIKYKTKHGWVNYTKGVTLMDPQLLIVDIRQREITDNSSDDQKIIPTSTVQQKYEMDKYSNISLRRATLFSFFCHHINVRNNVIGTFARVFLFRDNMLSSSQHSKDFMTNYFPVIRDTMISLLPSMSKAFPEFCVETFLNGCTEEKINLLIPIQWMESFVFNISEKDASIEEFDLDKILSASRSMELFRTLLFESKKAKPLSRFLIHMLSQLLRTSTFLDDLAMTTALILQSAISASSYPVNELNSTSPGEPTQVLERKLMALSTLDLAMDLWKQLLQCCMLSDLPGHQNVTARLLLSIIRAFYPTWNNEMFHFLPVSIVRGIIEMFSYMFKCFRDLSTPTNSLSENLRRPVDLSSLRASRRIERRNVSRPQFQPDPAAVQMCVDMGFDQQTVSRAMRALRSNDVAMIVPYIVETPFGDMMEEEEEAEMVGEDTAIPTEESNVSSLVEVPSLLARSRSSSLSSEEWKRLPLETVVLRKLQPALYDLCRRLIIRMIKSGAIPADGVLDTDLTSSNTHVDRNIFTVMVLNSALKALEHFSWTEMTIKIVLIQWISLECVDLLSLNIGYSEANSLYGLLHSLSILLSCRVVNCPQFRPMGTFPEYFLLLLSKDSRFKNFQSLLISQLRSFYVDLQPSTIHERDAQKWALPALLILGYLNQPVLCNSHIDVLVKELDSFMKYNPERANDLEALLCTTDRLKSSEVKTSIERFQMYTPDRALPLVESSLSIQEMKQATELALKFLAWVNFGSDTLESKVAAIFNSYVGNLTRACLQLLVQFMGIPAVRDFCQQEKILHIIFSLKVSFEGMHQIIFSVLQRYLEDEAYLKQTMKVIMKLVYDRLSTKTETRLPLRQFMEVASPLLYRNQSFFMEELQDVFTLEASAGNGLVIYPQERIPNGESAPNSALKSTAVPTDTQNSNEDAADMHVAKRMRTDRSSIVTKVVESTPLKKRSDSTSKVSRVAVVQELIDYIISDIVGKWASAMTSSSNDLKSKSSSSFSIAECFLILADLVATFPTVLTCLQRSKFRDESLRQIFSSVWDSQLSSTNEFHFLKFVLEQFLPSPFFELIKSKPDSKSVDEGASILDACFYFLAAVVSRPGEGRATVIVNIGELVQKLEMVPVPVNIIRLSELLMAFLVPSSKWTSRELFVLPVKDITSALLDCNIQTKLISLFNSIKNTNSLDEKVLQSIVLPLDILLKRQYPASTSSPVKSITASTNDELQSDRQSGLRVNESADTNNNAPTENTIPAEVSRLNNTLHEFHGVMLPTEAHNVSMGAPSDDENDDSHHNEDGLEEYFEEIGDEDDDNGEDDDDEIDIDDGDEQEIDDSFIEHHHHHHHHHNGVIMDEEDEEDDDNRSEESNPSRSDISSVHRSETGDNAEDDIVEVEIDNDMDSDDESDEHEDENDISVQEHDEIALDDDIDGAEEDGHSDHLRMEDDDDDGMHEMHSNGDNEGHYNVEHEALVEEQDHSESDEPPHADSFLNNLGNEGGDVIVDGHDHDEDTGRFGLRLRRRIANDAMEEDDDHDDDEAQVMDEMEDAMQIFRDGEAVGSSHRRFRGQSRGGEPARFRSTMPPSVRIHVGMNNANGVEFSDAMTINDFQELFGGLLPNNLLQGHIPSGLNIGFGHSGHYQNETHQHTSATSHLRPHSLLEAVDNRRSRPSNGSGGNSNVSLAFGFMLGQGNQSRDFPFFSYESQMKQQRSHMPPRRKALGPLVSDRRWGTDLNDLDLPCSRPNDLSNVVETYLQIKIFRISNPKSKSGSSLAQQLRLQRDRRSDSLLRAGVSRLPFGMHSGLEGPALTRVDMSSGHQFDFSRLFAPTDSAESKEEGDEPLIESKEEDPITDSSSAQIVAPTTNSSSSSSALLDLPSFLAVQSEVVAPGNEGRPTLASNETVLSSENINAVEEDTGEDDEDDAMDQDIEDDSESDDDNEDDEDDEEDEDVREDMDVDGRSDPENDSVPIRRDEENENLTFVNSLPPELRAEVLMAAEEEFLRDLPASIQEEARAIREMQAMDLQLINYSSNAFDISGPDTATAPVAALEAASAAVPASVDQLPATAGPNSTAAAAVPESTRSSIVPSAVAPATTSLAATTSAVDLDVSSSRPSATPKPLNTNALYLPCGGNVSAKAVCFDIYFLVRLVQWIGMSKNDKLSGKFRVLATISTFDICRREVLRTLLGLMLNSTKIIHQALINFAHRSGTAVQLNEQILQNMLQEFAVLAARPDTFRRLLNSIVQIIKRVGYLAILEFFEADEEDSNTGAQKSVFKLLLQCLNRPNISTVDRDRTLQVIERVCKHFAKLSTEQANHLVTLQRQRATVIESVQQLETPEAEEGGEVPAQRLSTNSLASLAPSWSGQGIAAAIRSMHSAPQASKAENANKKRMTYPVLSQAEAEMLVESYVATDCGGISKKSYQKIFRYLSLTDGNWRLFLAALSEQASDLVVLSTLKFTQLDYALTEAREKDEDIATVMSRPEFSGSQLICKGEAGGSHILQETKLLGALKLMTILRSRSTTAATAESEIIAEYLREIPTSELWELLCSCLDKVGAIEEMEQDREARRKGRARTMSFSTSSASSAGATAQELIASSTSNSRPSNAAGTTSSNKPISTLTMRFIPLIEFFLSTFSRTLIATPPPVKPNDQAATSQTTALPTRSQSASTPSYGLELVRMNSNALPGSRFRQSNAFMLMQLEIEEDSAAAKLVRFAEQHQDLLNKVVHTNIHLLETTFAPLVNVTKLRSLLHFDIKREFFKSKLKKLRASSTRTYGGSLKITVRRAMIFEDSFHSLRYKTANEMRRRLVVSFQNEEGVDAGGLTREWYNVLAREIFNANYALFLSTGDGVTFQPNPHSSVNTDHLSYFKFVGRVIGKAICDGFLLDAHFTRSFYKHILGLPVTLQDLEAIEPAYYKSLQQLLDTPLEYLGLDLTFSAETNDFGAVTVTDLLPNGRNIPVTDDNKHEYIRLLAHHRMTTAIRKQIDAFLEGFHELVPAELISIFDASELELLISGLPDIDLDDLRAHTDYAGGYKASDPVISWFWTALRSFSKEEKALFLQFVTGTSKVPLDGFKALHGSDGLRKFNIHRAFGGDEKLPAAHTCFNQLDLPEYSSEEKLHERLLLAIREGSEGFGFA